MSQSMDDFDHETQTGFVGTPLQVPAPESGKWTARSATGGGSGGLVTSECPRRTTLDKNTAPLPRCNKALDSRMTTDGIIDLSALEEAIGLIPMEEKAAYLEALERCPELVEMESDPVRFLIRESFDAWAAAARLVKFWHMRKQIFKDRAFLPMCYLDGNNGALSEEDMEIFRTGYLRLIPHVDENGREGLFLYFDGGRVQGEKCSPAIRLRCFFYALTVLAEDPNMQTEGLKCVVALSETSFDRLFDPGRKMKRELFETAMPIRMKRVYMVHCPSNTNKTTFLMDWIMPSILHLAGPFLGKFLTVISGEAGLPHKLQSHGFEPDCLPEALGGTWGNSEFFAWMEQRSLVELQMYCHSAAAPSAEGDSSREDCVALAVAEEPPECISTPHNSDSSVLVARAPGTAHLGMSKRDVKGSPPKHKNRFQQLLDALDLIPDEDKAEYLEAMEAAPRLVETELDKRKFLEGDRFDSAEAADMIVTFWRLRKRIFAERAFLPMNHTGSGALSPTDLETLKAGTLAMLPDNEESLPVLCWNRAKGPGRDSLDSELRCLFYLLCVMSEHDRSGQEGFVCLFLLSRESFIRPIISIEDQVTELLQQALPIRAKSVHLFCIPPPTGQPTFLEIAVPTTTQLLYKFFGASARQSMTDVALGMTGRLQKLGFREEGVPACAGGTWQYDSVVPWMERRLKIEAKEGDSNTPSLDSKPPAKQETGKMCRRTNPDELSGATALVALGSKRDHASLRSHCVPKEDVTSGASSNQFAFVSEPIYSKPMGWMKLMQEAIDSFPQEEKAAYLEALSQAPYLVDTESPPFRFLSRQKNDPTAAASQLVLYWKVRKQVFGSAAFLPINQTGQGALSKEDLTLLSTGFMFLLPNDREGRSVVCLDRSRADNRATTESSLRCLFYWLQCIAENDASQTDGFVLFIALRKPVVDLDLIVVFPIGVKAVHLLCCAPKAALRTYVTTVIPVTLKLLGPLASITTIHLGQCGQELLQSLQPHGFEKEGIPTLAGGSWDYETMSAYWNADRARVEWPRQVKFVETTRRTGRLGPSVSPTKIPTTKATPNPSDEIMQEGLIELQETINLMCAGDKAAFLEAQMRAPELIEKESNPLRFLRFDKGDGRSAALRLVKFWKSRKQLFGERAFLPMDLSGKGALSPDDVEVVSTGVFAILPRDGHGRQVLCFDRSRLERKMFGSSSKIRAFFYMFWKASENESTVEDGCTCLGIFTQQSNEEFDPRFFEKFMALGFDRDGAIPIRANNIHLLCSSPGVLKRLFVERFVPQFVQISGRFVQGSVEAHVGDSEKELSEKLKPYGIYADAIPPSIGGSWSYENVARWVREQQGQHPSEFERGERDAKKRKNSPRQSASVHNAGARTDEFALASYAQLPGAKQKNKGSRDLKKAPNPAPGGRQGQPSSDKRNLLTAPLSQLSAEDKIARRRQQNAIHSRKKRERQRNRLESLQIQLSEYRTDNKRLAEENAHLEEMLEVALSKVAAMKDQNGE